MDIPDDLRALVHRWSAPVVTGYGFAWECADCEIVASGMPPDRTAICKGRLVAEIVRLRGLLPESPVPTPGPSSVVAQAAGEGGGLRERLARLVADGLPVTLAYHPDADPGDGSGWSVEVGDRHAYGQLEDALTRATGPFSVWNESKSMDLGEG